MTEQVLPAESAGAAEAAPPETTRNPFVTIGFRFWWAASIFAGLGVGIQTTTVPLFIKDRVSTDHRELAIAAALMCQQLPAALFALIGGVVADRVERRRILIRTYSVAASVSLTYVFLSGFDASFVWPVFILCAVVGSAGAFTNPARQSMMPQILRPVQLQNGVIFGTMAYMASLQFIGPSLGGVLAGTAGLTIAFAAEVLTLSLAAIVFSRVATDAPVPSGRHVFHDLADGVRFVAGTPWLLGILLLGTVPGFLLIGPFAVTVVAVVNDVLKTNDSFVGFLWGAFGGGILAGSMILAVVRLPHRGFFLCISVVFGGVFATFYGLSTSIPLTLLILAVYGITGPAIFINFAVSLIQENVGREMMGRVMSMWGLAFTLSSALGYAQSGLMANAFGPRVTIVSSALATLVIGIAAVAFLRPVRRLD